LVSEFLVVRTGLRLRLSNIEDCLLERATIRSSRSAQVQVLCSQAR
jgi:hypothetical protein